MTEHDSDAWETVSGWIWSCRTCMAHGVHETQAEAQAGKREHDASPVPWWVAKLEANRA